MNSLTLHSLIEKEKLNSSNFFDWHINLRIILKYEGKLQLIKTSLHDPPMSLLNRHACKMEEGQSVSSHVSKMKSYIDKFEHLGHHMPHVLAVNTILDVEDCREKYVVQECIPSLHMNRDGGVKRKSWKRRKGKSKYRKKVPLPLKKEIVAKDAECFPCENIGHRKRNHPCYLVELKRSKTEFSGNRKASGSPL
ncbi:hypothetical protein Tco_0196698 [Tanacetum coccineum]